MAFRKKAGLIMAYKPDILIIQECESLDKFRFGVDLPKPGDALWFGNNQHKGIGIFSFGKLKLRVLDEHNTALQLIIPIAVTNGKVDFNLFAIWAHNPADPDGRYVEQIWKAIHHYESSLSQGNNILIGDFNSNTIWDKKRRLSNHSNVVKFLREKGIVSTYHSFFKQTQGKEPHPTFYLYKHIDKPYHLDYCFASGSLAALVKTIEIGEHSYWSKYSDHVPLMVKFNLRKLL
jgi:exodeoxyribonuclease-3